MTGVPDSMWRSPARLIQPDHHCSHSHEHGLRDLHRGSERRLQPRARHSTARLDNESEAAISSMSKATEGDSSVRPSRSSDRSRTVSSSVSEVGRSRSDGGQMPSGTNGSERHRSRSGEQGRRDRGHGSERCHESSRFHHSTTTGRPSRNGPRPKPLVLGWGQRRQRNLLPGLLGPVNRSPWLPAFLRWDGPALTGRTATDRGVRIGREDTAPTDARTSPRLCLDRDQQSAFPVNTDFHQPGYADRYYVYVDIVTATDGPGYGSKIPRPGRLYSRQCLLPDMTQHPGDQTRRLELQGDDPGLQRDVWVVFLVQTWGPVFPIAPQHQQMMTRQVTARQVTTGQVTSQQMTAQHMMGRQVSGLVSWSALDGPAGVTVPTDCVWLSSCCWPNTVSGPSRFQLSTP